MVAACAWALTYFNDGSWSHAPEVLTLCTPRTIGYTLNEFLKNMPSMLSFVISLFFQQQRLLLGHTLCI